jgi:hypothetical protein
MKERSSTAMEFSRDTLELLQKTAQEATRPTLLPIPGDLRHCYLVYGGRYERIDLQPDTRLHRPGSIGDLVGFVEWWAKEAPDAKMTLWHHDTAIVLVLDERDRRDRALYPLTLSRPYLHLQKLDAGDCCANLLEHRQLVRLLRVEFAGCVMNADLIPMLNKVDWTKNEAANSRADRGRESLGKSIQAELVQAATIPEEIVLEVPVFENRDVCDTIQIRCALEILPQDQRFRLTPFPGQVPAAMATAQDKIHELLDELLHDGELSEKIAVFHGVP